MYQKTTKNIANEREAFETKSGKPVSFPRVILVAQSITLGV